MHEVAAMQSVVRSMLDTLRAARAARVTSAHLVLGASGHFTEDAARQHFAVLAEGTPAAGASLTIDWLPATYQCFTCLRRFTSRLAPAEVRCPDCQSVALEIAHRDVCYIDEIEVAFDDTPVSDMQSAQCSIDQEQTTGVER